MPLPLAPKRPPHRTLLGLVLLVCALIVVACGSSSPSSSTSAGVAGSKTTAGGSATSSTTTGPTAGGSAGSGSASTGTTGSTQTRRRHVKRATKEIGSAGTAPGRRARSTALRRCLEQNGIKAHTKGSQASTPAQLEEALKHCDPQLAQRRTRSLRSSAGVRRKLLARPGYRQALARFTSCIRKHGVPNFPEANTSGNGPLYPAGAAKQTPQLRAAQQACISQLRVR